MRGQISLEDARTAQEQLNEQFNKVGRLLVLSNEETWKLFLEQEESDIIPREHLPVIESVLVGRPIVPIEVFRDMSFEALKKFGYCPIIRVLHKMSDGDLMPELVQHCLKLTADVLEQKALPDPSA